MEPVMYPVVSDNGIAACPHLDTGQCIAIDVIVLDQPATFAEDVYSALMSIVDLILPAVRIKPCSQTTLSLGH